MLTVDGEEEDGAIIGWTDENEGDGESTGWIVDIVDGKEEGAGGIIGWVVGTVDGEEYRVGVIIGWMMGEVDDGKECGVFIACMLGYGGDDKNGVVETIGLV